MAFKMKYNKGNFPFKMTWEDRYGDQVNAKKLGNLQRSGETRDEWQSRANPKDYKVKTRKDDSKRKVVDKTDGNRKVTKYDKEGNIRKTVTWNGLKRTVEKPGFKDTKVGKFLGVGQGDKRKHNRAARKTEGSKLRQSLRRNDKNNKQLAETKKPTTPEDVLSGNSSYTGKVSDWYRKKYTKPEWLKK